MVGGGKSALMFLVALNERRLEGGGGDQAMARQIAGGVLELSFSYVHYY